uniref:CYCLIN domain-containing protein n=1 Tax=Rhodnius prolixus TaxID=13249 RepID=T1HST5_RHOPR
MIYYQSTDWLIEICSMYKFHRETYYLTMTYFDRYVTLSPKNKILKKDLQLLGLTSLLLATKIEEMKSLPIEDIIYLSDNAYTINQILETEKSIIRVLDWNCYLTTPNMWLLRFIHNIKPKINKEEYILCTRLIDLATMDLEYLKYPNCVIAASSLELILSLDVLKEASLNELSLSSRLCFKWLAKYWREMKRFDNLPELEKNISNFPVHTCCPNFQ